MVSHRERLRIVPSLMRSTQTAESPFLRPKGLSFVRSWRGGVTLVHVGLTFGLAAKYVSFMKSFDLPAAMVWDLGKHQNAARRFTAYPALAFG